MKRFTRTAALLLAVMTLLSVFSLPASAASSSCAVVGADLDAEELAAVYAVFGFSRGDVPELTLTNAEERAWLQGKVEDAAIGSKSISCVYVEFLPDGSGLHISCTNINWCTKELYENALVTAGVTDANVIVAAPFPVSGTAALAGICKAYENSTGEVLDDLAKDAAVEELVTTGQLADVIGSEDAAVLVTELKAILDETSSMTDEELRTEILNIASEIDVTLTEDQIRQLIDLVRTLEKLDADALREKVEQVQGTVRKITDTAQKAADTAKKVSDFFASVKDFFSRLFGRKG